MLFNNSFKQNVMSAFEVQFQVSSWRCILIINITIFYQGMLCSICKRTDWPSISLKIKQLKYHTSNFVSNWLPFFQQGMFHRIKSSVIPEAVDKSIVESLQMGFMHCGWQHIYHKANDIGSRISDATTQCCCNMKLLWLPWWNLV